MMDDNGTYRGSLVKAETEIWKVKLSAKKWTNVISKATT